MLSPPAILCSGASKWLPVCAVNVRCSTSQPFFLWSAMISDRTGGCTGQIGQSAYTGCDKSINRIAAYMLENRNRVEAFPLPLAQRLQKLQQVRCFLRGQALQQAIG